MPQNRRSGDGLGDLLKCWQCPEQFGTTLRMININCLDFIVAPLSPSAPPPLSFPLAPYEDGVEWKDGEVLNLRVLILDSKTWHLWLQFQSIKN